VQVKRIFADDQTHRDRHGDDSWKSNKPDLNLYQIRDLCPYGTLETLIRQQPDGRLNEEAAKFYAGEIVCYLKKSLE